VSNASGSLSFTKGTTGANAALTVDGIPISSASNTVTTALTDVTLQLGSASPGTQVNLNITADTSAAKAAINSFVSKYNTIITGINQQFAYDPSAQTAGPLAGDSTLRVLQGQLLSDISFSSTSYGSIVNLGSLGVNLQNDGTLAVDDNALTQALSSNYSSVISFFQNTSSASFAQNFGTDLRGLNDSSVGAVSVSISGILQSERDIDNRISALDLILQQKQDLLTQQFSQVDAELRQLPLLQQQIAAQLGTLGK
jgi:flagellar hook-associated protein 2